MSTTLFGAALRKLRREKEVNLVQLSKASEVSITHISDIERGRRNPPKRSVIALWMDALDSGERLDEFCDLARRSVKKITINTEGKNERLTKLMVSLTRRYAEDGFSEHELLSIESLLRGKQVDDTGSGS